MLDAMWEVTFSSPSHRDSGAGVAVLQTGRVLGGDSQYSYVGDFNVRPDGMAEARLTVKRHASVPHGVSIFGPADKFDLAVAGRPDSNGFRMQGNVVGKPGATIVIGFRRVAELH